MTAQESPAKGPGLINSIHNQEVQARKELGQVVREAAPGSRVIPETPMRGPELVAAGASQTQTGRIAENPYPVIVEAASPSEIKTEEGKSWIEAWGRRAMSKPTDKAA